MDDFPEEGELVICTVKETFEQGVYVILDEYNKEGYLPLKEISLKWIKNIHDYVKEGQKVVLKVISVDKERNIINLSLRTVSDAERRAKIEDVKRIQRENKFIEFLFNELKIDKDKIREILAPLEDKYGTIYQGIENIANDNALGRILNCDDITKKKIVELINRNVKAKKVKVTGYIMLKSYDSDGVEKIKKNFDGIEDENVRITYVGAPIYKIDVISDNYKAAGKNLKVISEKILTSAKKLNCIAKYSNDIRELLHSKD